MVPMAPTQAVGVISDGESFESFMRFIKSRSRVVFDYETSGTAWYQHARACGIALAAWDDNGQLWNRYIPFRHETPEPQLSIDRIGPAIKEVLEDPYVLKIAHNFKFEDHMSRREGWHIAGPRYDTMIAARLYDENTLMALKKRAETDLKFPQAATMEKALDREVAMLAKLNRMGVTKYKALKGYSQVNTQLCGIYACYDTMFCGGLYCVYEKFGVSTKYQRIWNTEMRLNKVLTDMEEWGLPIDVEYVERLRDTVQRRKSEIQNELVRRLGRDYFDVGKDQQLRNYLLNVLRLPLEKKTRGDKFAVDKEVLSSFALQHPELGLILEWRDANKIDTTYTTSLLEGMDSKGRVHTDFRQAGANTGRMSSANPINLQNITAEDQDRAELFEMDYDPWSVRRAFCVPKDQVRVYADYSQVELRVLAKESMDPIMVEAFIAGEDLHDRTSREVFGTTEKKYRRLAKVVNFGLCMPGDVQVLTKQDGYVRLDSVAQDHLLWDGVEWVSHDGLISRGYREVITYDGVTATPCHEVYTEDGDRLPIGCLASEVHPRRIAVGESGGVLRRYSSFDRESWEAREESGCGSCVYCVRRREDSLRRQHQGGSYEELPLPTGEVPRPPVQNVGSAIRRYGAALREGHARIIAQLQGARHKSAVQIQRALYSLGVVPMASVGFPEFGFGSHRQRWPLQSHQFTIGGSKYESTESAQATALQAGAFVTGRQSLHAPERAEGVSYLHEELRQGFSGEKKVQVYDLLNAGPRHRFTVNGRIVSNSYCMTEVGFSRNAKIPIEEARQHLETFFKRFHGVKTFRETFWQTIRNNPPQYEFHNRFGRPRRLQDIVSPNDYYRGRAERQAIGTLIQGTAAELTRESLVRISEWIEAEDIPARLCNTVHDENQIDVLDRSCLPYVIEQTRKLMEDFPEFHPVPIVVDAEISETNWAEKKAYEG